MKYSVRPTGICASKIDFELDGNIVKNVSFLGGCNGNLKAVSALVEGRTVEELSGLLKGITCGFKKTSCSDQLVQALTEAYEKEQGSN